ncbi:MAG: arylamine N-acetyltransferase [Cyclobacteriaceae bacterium]
MARPDLFKTKTKVNQIPVDAYLTRIHLEKEDPSLAFLKKLQKNHLYYVPFENLDIVFRKRLDFNVGRFFKKIVTKKRGGIGTELNLLFYHLLVGLGFDCCLVSARIYNNDKWGPDFDLPLVVSRIDGTNYLTSVDSLSAIIEPKKLIPDSIQLDYNRYFRFVRDPDENFILLKSADSINFQRVYQFEMIPKEIIQFLERYSYFYESEDSPYFQKKIVFKLTKEGSIKLTDTSIQIVERGIETNIPLLHDDDFASKLQEHFGLDYEKLFRERLDQ